MDAAQKPLFASVSGNTSVFLIARYIFPEKQTWKWNWSGPETCKFQTSDFETEDWRTAKGAEANLFLGPSYSRICTLFRLIKWRRWSAVWKPWQKNLLTSFFQFIYFNEQHWPRPLRRQHIEMKICSVYTLTKSVDWMFFKKLWKQDVRSLWVNASTLTFFS